MTGHRHEAMSQDQLGPVTPNASPNRWGTAPFKSQWTFTVLIPGANTSFVDRLDAEFSATIRNADANATDPSYWRVLCK